ncbi:MAG TPA: MbtH family NRPS accessory protein [Acidimicrobiales bacterium]
MDEPTDYRVVVNHEEQYAIWPTDQTVPAGWREAGFSGDKEACLAHVEQVWTDMRPRSVREERAT